MTTLQEMKQHNPIWFTEENKRFFKDVDYWVMQSESGKDYLVRSTFAWMDMFGAEGKLHYRINLITENLKVGSLVDDIFEDMDEVEIWLEDN